MVVLRHDGGLPRDALSLTIELGRVVIVDVLALGCLRLVALVAVIHAAIFPIVTAHVEAAGAIVSVSRLVSIITTFTTSSIVEEATATTTALITIITTVIAASAATTVSTSLVAALFIVAVVEVSRSLTAAHSIVTTGVRREGRLGVELVMRILRLL